jgi:carbonic anhydrase
MPETIDQLLTNNRDWAAGETTSDPAFFARLAELQDPDFLWIGCSDSRVPANQITGLRPGEVFVHRNIANIVELTDPNCMAVLDYAVRVLEVDHVIVCGHYGCGGVQATITGGAPAAVDAWLTPIQSLYAREQSEFEGLDDEAKLKRLCELNVLHQARNVCLAPPVVDAWQSGHELLIHAWIYSINDGLLHRLDTFSSSDA